MRRIGTFSSLIMAALVLISVAACTQAVAAPDRGAAAWSERLTGQAQSIEREAARRELANAAYKQRLVEQGAAYQAEKASAERAKQAWSTRLTKLAEYLQDGGGMLGPAD